MNATGKLLLRCGHLWSITVSLGLWFLLLRMLPEGLVTITHALIDKGLNGAGSVLLQGLALG